MQSILPDYPGQLVTSLPDDNIKETLYHVMPNMWEKKMVEQGYNYIDPFYGWVLWDKKQQEKQGRVQEKESSHFWQFKRQRLGSRTKRKVGFPVLLHVQTYYGWMHYAQVTDQASKTTEKQAFWEKEEIHQAWSKCYGAETS